MRLALNLPVGDQVYGGRLDRILDMVAHAEDAGVDTVVAVDHVVMGNRLDRYPFGTFGFAEDEPWLEQLTLLTAIAARTSTLRLATGILIAGLRPPGVLAKTVATLDLISGGRVELGVGTGWQREEYEAAGLDFATRARRLDDTIAAARALWRGGPADFASETATFAGVRCDPRPVRPGGPPVLFAGPLTARNRRRVVEMGDGWIPIMGEPARGVRDGIEVLREALAAAGRDRDALRVRVPLPAEEDASGKRSVERTLAGAAAFADCGVTEVSVPLASFVRDPAGIGPFLDRLGAARGEIP